MKRRVIANLKWQTKANRNAFKDDLATKLSSVPAFDEDVEHGEDMEGNPHSSIDVRPESDADADDLYNYVKGKMDNIPGVTGRVTVHDCRHDEGPPFQPCKPDKEYEA